MVFRFFMIFICFVSLVNNTISYQQSPILYATGQAPQSVVSADFNNDDHWDLAITNYYGNTISILLGLGDGSFRLPSINFASNVYNPYWLVAQDFNSDDNMDLAVCNEGSNNVAIFFGRG